jgi:hypothetical protein
VQQVSATLDLIDDELHKFLDVGVHTPGDGGSGPLGLDLPDQPTVDRTARGPSRTPAA